MQEAEDLSLGELRSEEDLVDALAEDGPVSAGEVGEDPGVAARDDPLAVRDDDEVGDRVEDRFPLRLAAAHLFLGEPVCLALLRLAQLALHDRHEARQVPFHQVIVRPRLHGGYREVFADLAGDDDEGDVLPAFVQDMQGAERVEGRHPVIGYHHVPLVVLQRPAHPLRGLDAPVLQLIAAAYQLAYQEQAVFQGILDKQNLQGN